MDVLRRNTDYALRMMVNLAAHFNEEFTSAAKLASGGDFSYQLACKLLQKLHKAKLIKSTMGPKGGFALSREPSEINLLEIINAVQGGIRLNRCLLGGKGCELQPECEISAKLAQLQVYIDGYLRKITLAEILKAKGIKTQ